MSILENDQRYASLLAHFRKEAKGGDVDEAQVKSFYEYIISHEHGESILDSVVNPQRSFAHQVALKPAANDDFKNSTSSEAGLLNLWFYTQLDLKANNIGKRFQGSAGGFSIGLPVGALYGTLWYNDLSSLSGSCSYFMGSATQYTYINIWKGNVHVATFHGGLVGSSIGGSWGSGKWV
ncbi:hypothetical protein F4680DRAFT_426541 [Xylaria scruposa]|nr:hypothetical protein F4680DRAFT_426541 [Xylaria scruposa]